MIIQINTDKTINGGINKQEYFTSQVEEELKRYQSHITRIEVHLKDENGNKDGLNDKLCTLEARIKGKQPIAVTSKSNTVEAALVGGIYKIKVALKTIIGRIENH